MLNMVFSGSVNDLAGALSLQPAADGDSHTLFKIVPGKMREWEKVQ